MKYLILSLIFATMYSSCIEEVFAPITGPTKTVFVISSLGAFEYPVYEHQIKPIAERFESYKDLDGIYVMGRNLIVFSYDQEKIYFDILSENGICFLLQYDYDSEIYSKLKNNFPTDTIIIDWLNWTYE